MKIVIAVPSHAMVPMTFAADLASLYAFSSIALPDGTTMGIKVLVGTYVHTARHELMQECLQDDVDYVLFLDSDMRFPRDLLIRLLAHQVPMVGINYSTKAYPGEFVAIKRIATVEDPIGERLVTGDDSEGLEEVEGIGFGAVLIDMRSVRGWYPTDPDVEPPFFFRWDEGLKKQWGEDVLFCNYFREQGGRIFVDHLVSRACAHTGLFDFRTSHAFISKQMQDEGPPEE